MVEVTNHIDLNETNNKLSSRQKWENFKEKAKRAARHTLASTSIAFTIVTPTASALVAACDRPDNTAPEIHILVEPRVTITEPKNLRVEGSQVKLGTRTAASCNDPESGISSVTYSVNGGSYTSSSTTINGNGNYTVRIKAINGDDKSSNDSFVIVYEEVVSDPEWSIYEPTVTVFKGDSMTREGKDIFAGGKKIFAWNDDNYTISIDFGSDKDIQLPYQLNNDGNAVFTLTNKGKNPKSRTTKITTEEVDNNKAPEITRKYNGEINIIGGVNRTTSNNQLSFGDVVLFEGIDDNTKDLNMTFEVKIGGKWEEPGGTLDLDDGQTYKGKFTVKDEEQKSNSEEFDIKSESIDLTNLSNLDMQVGVPVDLLGGIEKLNGLQIEKIEIKVGGQRFEVSKSDYHNYVPSQSGKCYIYFTEKGPFGNVYHDEIEAIIRGPEYQEPMINSANIMENYPRYNNLQKSTKDFIYPHILASYLACNRSKQDNRVHVIMGENTNARGVENIGQFDDPSDHAKEGGYRLRILCPDTSLKGCNDYWDNLEKYINQHPDNYFVISCAAGGLGGGSLEELEENRNTAPQRKILENKNVIMVCSVGNWTQSGRKIYNENVKDGNWYNASSTNSELNNKISVTGYNSRGLNNYFSPRYSVYGGLRTAMPIGYQMEKGNIVMPMIPLINSDNTEDQISTSSMPAPVLAAILGNAIDIVMSNHPGITAEDGMTIIKNKYFIDEKFQYKDETTNWDLVDGGDRYFVDIENLIDNEILQVDKMNKLQFNADVVELPYGKGVGCIGKGCQFKYKGEMYNVTKDNQSILDEALKSGEVKRYYSNELRKEQGGNSVDFYVYGVDKNGHKIPDVQLHVVK